jgi:hypothetical protein
MIEHALIAISSGFNSSAYVERNLEKLLALNASLLLLEEKNGPGAKALNAKSIQYTKVELPSRASRQFFKKLLTDCSYVLVFWDGHSLSELVFEARLLGIPLRVVPVEVSRVLNKDRGDDFDLYIGRGTPWGNPFIVGTLEGQYPRDEAIELYKDYFKRTILADSSKHRGLLAMRGYRLGCHCKPLNCHGDVIATYLNSLDPDEVAPKTNNNFGED